MKDDDIARWQLSDWQPETDPMRCKLYGKSVEELGELLIEIGRCQIQGIDKHNPTTGLVNREGLENEIADVSAFNALMIELLGLDLDRIEARAQAKMDSKRPWITGTATNLLPST